MEKRRLNRKENCSGHRRNFRDCGFSGQPFCSTWAFRKKNVQISLNLLPQVNRQHLLAIYQKQTNKKAEHLLSGIFPQKLAALLLKQTGYKAGEILQEESFLEILSLVSDLRLQ